MRAPYRGLAGAEKEIVKKIKSVVKKIKSVVIFKKKVGRETGRDSYFASHSIMDKTVDLNLSRSSLANFCNGFRDPLAGT